MQRSTARILTTFCGSLARPADLLAMMQAKERGQPYDQQAFAARVRDAVAEVVHQQVETGVDIVTDGEQGKASFVTYIGERLAGFEPRQAPPRAGPWEGSREAWPSQVLRLGRRRQNVLPHAVWVPGLSPQRAGGCRRTSTTPAALTDVPVAETLPHISPII
jgi:5-methyltetrahydropteroyltriglutamate--homocysteine methyltransferase